jgi:hypothetical protein
MQVPKLSDYGRERVVMVHCLYFKLIISLNVGAYATFMLLSLFKSYSLLILFILTIIYLKINFNNQAIMNVNYTSTNNQIY